VAEAEVNAALGVSLTTNEAKNRPAASRITVTDDAADGRPRDQRTATSPTFGRRSRPLSSTRNRELAVNRTACRESSGTGTGAARPSAPPASR